MESYPRPSAILESLTVSRELYIPITAPNLTSTKVATLDHASASSLNTFLSAFLDGFQHGCIGKEMVKCAVFACAHINDKTHACMRTGGFDFQQLVFLR